MRILHTSDWHLGKLLEGYSRLEEQEEFLEELIQIAEEQQVDLIIIAGDIYDTGNPPARAEKLFYHGTRRLSKGGRRPILIIAGNHDHPERLTAASPLAYEQGIILLGTPKTVAEIGEYSHYAIVDAGEGYVEIRCKEEVVVAITIPYPSEKRLNEILSEAMEEEERQKSYSQKIGEILDTLSQKYREDTINIAAGHFFMMGGEGSDSERPIQLGGSLAVEPKVLPKKAQYVALGHLHRPQKVRGCETTAIYSGSPIQYSKSEIHHPKCVYIVDIKAGVEPTIETVYLRNYKPIEVWACSSIEEALQRCEENRDKRVWVYLEIHTDRVLLQSEIKQMRKLKEDIVEIRPIFGEQEEAYIEEMEQEKSIQELFREFYVHQRQVQPTEELIEIFLRVTMEKEEEEDETQEA